MPSIVVGLVLVLAGAAQQAAVTGVVLDSTGAPIANAIVRLEVSGTTIQEVRTGVDGRFQLRAETGEGRLVVTSPGFAQAARDVSAASGELRITLEPAPFFEAVNVTSSRTEQPRADPTTTVTVVPASELLSSAAVSIDDALKMVPNFTLFRRTSARVANPTAQGVSLRGLGGIGPSRSLVLGDGLPLNDAFGGWVYWDKLPQAAIDRIEVQRGSGSDLYGADAVGGVIQILTIRPGRPTGRALVEAGNMATGRVSLFGGSRTGGWTYSAAGEWFHTGGYIPVAEEQEAGQTPRGPIDTELASEHRSGLVTLGYQAAAGWRVEARGNVFDEDRLNGTPQSINATASRQLSGDAAGGVGGGLLSARAFGGTQGYDQTFTAVSADRTSDRLVRVQRVPTTTFGVGGQWLRPVGAHSVLAGAEMRQVEGRTIERAFTAAGAALPMTRAGGLQRISSGFVQGTWQASDRLTLVAGAQGSAWYTEGDDEQIGETLGAFNPRASFAYRIGESGASVRGSVYRGFRAPTLNEFYRGFRAGNVQTNPNEHLRPETLTGGDGGVLISRGPVSARVTAFWNVLDEAITNVTISITPQLITKQRANADRVRAAGLELESDLRLTPALSMTGALGVVRSRFTGESDLHGNRVPQVPHYTVGIGGRYTPEGWTASAQLRVTGPQYEDDQNRFILRRATVFAVYAGRTLRGGVQAFVAVENLFDAEYDVGRTPFLTIGLPRAFRAGVLVAIP